MLKTWNLWRPKRIYLEIPVINNSPKMFIDPASPVI